VSRADAPRHLPAGGSRRHGPAFWLALVAGWLVIAWALRGVWRQRGGTVPRGFARWFLGVGLGHDLLVLPLVAVAAALTGRLPRLVRLPVQAGLAVTAVVTVFAWPLLRGYGRRSTNPTVLPLDYPTAYATVLAVVWAIVVVLVVAGVARTRRAGADR
jgi:hypothetical protein